MDLLVYNNTVWITITPVFIFSIHFYSIRDYIVLIPTWSIGPLVYWSMSIEIGDFSASAEARDRAPIAKTRTFSTLYIQL